MMKRLKILLVSCGALLLAGCAVPLGEDFTLTRDGGSALMYITNYKLQDYVPIPAAGERPVISVNNRGDLEISVEWKAAGVAVPQPFAAFLPGTFYAAKIRITAKPGYAFYSTPFFYPDGKTQNTMDDMGTATRTITVMYNSSDEARVTYITNYNLQSYVPVPMSGEIPVSAINNRADMTVTAAWSMEAPRGSGNFDPIPAPDEITFDLGIVYRAEIRLEAKEDYRFIPGGDFTYIEGAASIRPIPDPGPEVRCLEVTYMPTRMPSVINEFDLTPYIPKPMSGATPVLCFAAVQYSGIVNWKTTVTQAPLIGPFQAGTAYTAELALSPNAGYTVNGIRPHTFTHAGAEDITSQANSGTVIIKFPLSQAADSSIIVYDTILTGLLPKPINGITPVRSITGAQFTGTVDWTPADSIFQLGTAYTAALTLQAASGYTFTGINQNAFSHGAAGLVTNPKNSGVVTVCFPGARPPSKRVMSFGPANAGNSALMVMEEQSGDVEQVLIELPGGSEPVPYSANLLAGYTSPALVIIDGHGRTLNKTSPGPLITVSGDVTLTLQNITLEGYVANNTPLIVVRTGGKLILGNGAVITGNITSSDAGGIWVNGGTLIMNQGAVIKNMSARRGGGVLIDTNGRFLMTGGTIGGSGAGNHVSRSLHAAGGVLINAGSFDMYGGKIESNSADSDESGGGVGLIQGTFDQNTGTIKGNTARGDYSGGGVYVDSSYDSTFTMNNAAALIERNTALGRYSGGGAYIKDSWFTINNGAINNNTARRSDSGGGIYLASDACIYGGTITQNTAEKPGSGGGIFIGTMCICDMYGGTIRYNVAKGSRSGGGAGIFGEIGGHLVIHDRNVVIEHNRAEAEFCGGAVYVEAEGACTLETGTIQNNIVEGPCSGGGICLYEGAANIGQEALIKGNRAIYSGISMSSLMSAGAVYVYAPPNSYAGLEVEGTIGGNLPGDANTAVFGANGVYVTGNGQFFLGGTGKITGNTGGDNYGVYVDGTMRGNFILSGVVATENLVFLTSGATILLDNWRPPVGDPAVVANVTCESPIHNKTRILTVQGGNSTQEVVDAINNAIGRFLYEGQPHRLAPSAPEGAYSDSRCYGLYQDPLP